MPKIIILGSRGQNIFTNSICKGYERSRQRRFLDIQWQKTAHLTDFAGVLLFNFDLTKAIQHHSGR